MHKSFDILKIVVLAVAVQLGVSCKTETKPQQAVAIDSLYTDVPFIQETHDGFLIGKNDADNEVRSIAVDNNSTVWIATASGIFFKEVDSREWKPVIPGNDRGPA